MNVLELTLNITNNIVEFTLKYLLSVGQHYAIFVVLAINPKQAKNVNLIK